ncbi:hypothetical protein Vadar_031711 [Vaccinium darrowii]|uniref:Uncharacterized protein n=1 Tax=Vaccinium darrowii TaxID=229202 RepID=A0ACB7YA10_9ERIC|nr:hypothetical protein Vadar_031711 [Vaccinium darrowii]
MAQVKGKVTALINSGPLKKSKWRRAPFFNGGGDELWTSVDSFDPAGPFVLEPLLMQQECEDRNAEFIDPASILRLCIERGPTLEDVALLMRLGSRRPFFYDPLALTVEDNAMIVDLKLAAMEANKEGSNFDNVGHLLNEKSSSDKGSWGSWIRYFFKDIPADEGEKSISGRKYREDIYLAAFVSYFLSFFVLPGHSADMPSPFVFPLAVWLVHGEAIPLGPLFLGNLHHRLDSLHMDMERSSGRYKVWSYVHTSFLSAFLYSRFPSSASDPYNYSTIEEVPRVGKT